MRSGMDRTVKGCEEGERSGDEDENMKGTGTGDEVDTDVHTSMMIAMVYWTEAGIDVVTWPLPIVAAIRALSLARVPRHHPSDRHHDCHKTESSLSMGEEEVVVMKRMKSVPVTCIGALLSAHSDYGHHCHVQVKYNPIDGWKVELAAVVGESVSDTTHSMIGVSRVDDGHSHSHTTRDARGVGNIHPTAVGDWVDSKMMIVAV